MNCVLCGKSNESVEPGHDDGWMEIGIDPAVKEWACPQCTNYDCCPSCGGELSESFIREDLVDGVLISATRVSCEYCGFSDVVLESTTSVTLANPSFGDVGGGNEEQDHA